MKKIFNIRKIIDILVIIMLFIVSIKKGGFYKEDSIFFNLVITTIGLGYVIYSCYINYVKKAEKERCKTDIVQVFLLLLSFSYALPITFKNYSSMNDSIHEMIRYFDVFLIYTLVKSSPHKKIYMIGIYIIIFVQCLIGIDGIANRYLEPLLKHINSGYLTSLDVTRMSGTIQYANVFALMCAICGLLVFNRILKFVFNNESKKEKIILLIKFIAYNLFFIVYSSSIILSGSRYVIIMYICALILMLFTIKSNTKLLFLIQSVIIAVYTACINQAIATNLNSIYVYTIISYLVTVIIFTIIYFILNNKKILETLGKKNFIVGTITIVLLLLFILVGFRLKSKINISSFANENSISRNIYNLKLDEENKLSIKIKENEPLSRYKIEIFERNKNYETTLIQTYHYYSTISGKFEFNYTPEEDFKNLTVKVSVESGSIKVTEFKINRHNLLNYMLLPSNIIYRLIDSLAGTTSGNDRILYAKDALKIITSSPKNFIFGVGGEGFNNMYESLKKEDYSSTEVHNIYLQMFVESGLIGISIFVASLVLLFKNTKNSVYRLSLILFLIHGFFDLDFSFMFSMSIFAILLALQKEKKKVKKVNEKLLILKDVTSILVGSVVLILLVRQNMAYYTKIPKFEEKISLESQEKVILAYEKIIKLDGYDSSYRLNLNDEYLKYIELLKKSTNNLDKIDMVNEKINNNLQMITRYDKNNNKVMKKVNKEA